MRLIYKNEIFTSLKNSEYGIDNFEFEENGNVFKVKYLLNKFLWYNFVNKSDNWDLFTSTAGLYKIKETPVNRNVVYAGFPLALRDFSEWLNTEIKSFVSDMNTVDLWKEYQKQQTLTDVSEADYENYDKLSMEDKQQIVIGLNELKFTLSEQFITNENEQQILNNRINYLIEAVGRIENKTDYKSIVIASIITTIQTLSLDTERGNALWHFFVTALHYIHLLPN